MRLSKPLERKLHSINIAPVIVKTKTNVEDVWRDYLPYDASRSLRPFRLQILNNMYIERVNPMGYFGLIGAFKMFTGLFDRDIIETLADDKRVEKVYLDRINYVLYRVPPEGIYTIGKKRFTSTYWTRRLIGADKAEEKGITGNGVKVAVIDTGIQIYHKQIGRRGGRVRFYTVMPTQRIDSNGHGSWVATCIGGALEVDEGLSNVVGRKVYVQGIAPNTFIVAIKALGYVIGVGTTSQIIKALEIAVKNKVDVINMSLGGPTEVDNPEDDPYYNVMKTVVENNIIPVVAAGNEGPEPKTISSPGSMPQVLTVGAWDPINDKIADFSSRGPTPWGDIKPDVVAPGVNIDSGLTGILDYTFDKMPNRFSPLSGTSMATPHVAGLVALMREAHAKVLEETLTVDEIKKMMSEHAKEKGIEKDNNMGWGMITWDIYEWWLKTQYGVEV